MAGTARSSAVGDRSFMQRHPILSYFALTFAVSWSGALFVALPSLLRHERVPKMAGLMMFPVMLVGPSLVGIVLTRIVDGKEGLRDVWRRMRRVGFGARWYLALLIPPAVVVTVLLCLREFASRVYTPNRFFVGISFGIAAGLFEEIGWTGFAFPKMASQYGAAFASIVLGVLWGAWHLPVIDFLGTATPHGAYLPAFFLAFVAVLTAMRVLIAWLYTNTGSIAIAQLMHASSTGALVAFGPAGANAAQEAFWYGIYAGALWILAGIAILSGRLGKNAAVRNQSLRKN